MPGVETTALADAVPIGAVIPWAKSIAGVPSLPANFKECDGSAISDAESPMNGENLPDLNSANAFPRGNTTSGGTGGADTHQHTVDPDVGHQNTNHTGGTDHYQFDSTGGLRDTSSVSNVPTYVDMVYIMRIK